MNPALAALAVTCLAGGVLAVSARDIRAVVLGLLIVLVASPLVADPWPGPLPVLVRIAAALLATRLIVVGVRGLDATVGTRIGWLAAGVLSAAAAIAGAASHGLGAAPLGPAAAAASGFGLIALAVGPLVVARDVVRLSVGAVLLLAGAALVRIGLDQAPTDGEQLVAAFLTVGLGGAVAVIAAAATAAGGLEAASLTATGRGRRPPDAHRVTEAEGRRARPGLFGARVVRPRTPPSTPPSTPATAGQPIVPAEPATVEAPPPGPDAARDEPRRSPRSTTAGRSARTRRPRP